MQGGNFVIEPGDLGAPHPVEIYVHPDIEAVRAWAVLEGVDGMNRAAAFTALHDDVPPGRPVATLHFAADTLHLSLIVHEVVHAALDMYAHDHVTPGARATAHIDNHSEILPEMIGNLSALVWYHLQLAGFNVGPDE